MRQSVSYTSPPPLLFFFFFFFLLFFNAYCNGMLTPIVMTLKKKRLIYLCFVIIVVVVLVVVGGEVFILFCFSRVFSRQFTDPPYRGFSSQFTCTPDFNDDVLPHNKLRCLECSIPLIKTQQQGPGSEATSHDDLSFGGGGGGARLFKLGSSNSLSPEMRARSVTTESSPSGEGSASDTPQSSLPSQENNKSSTSTPEGNSPPEDRGRRNAPDGGNRSPLIRHQKVVSEEADAAVRKDEINGGGEPRSGSKSTGSGSDGGSRTGNGTDTGVGGEGEVRDNTVAESGSPEAADRDEEVKDRQDVQINVIEPR